MTPLDLEKMLAEYRRDVAESCGIPAEIITAPPIQGGTACELWYTSRRFFAFLAYTGEPE